MDQLIKVYCSTLSRHGLHQNAFPYPGPLKPPAAAALPLRPVSKVLYTS